MVSATRLETVSDMATPSALRPLLAPGVVLATAIGVLAVSGNVAAALIALAGGTVAALALRRPDEPPEPAMAPPPAPAVPAATIGSVIEAIVEPVLLVSHGRVVEANAAAQSLLGSHIIGQDVRLAIRHPAAAERLVAPPGAADRAPISLIGLGTLDQRWELRVTDIEGGRVAHLIDQTGSHAAEKMRVDFVANASHELRTPLASILGYAETLADDAGDDPAMRGRFLKVMADEARRMQRLVEDLISLSRIEAEKYRLPDTSVDLSGLVGEVCGELADPRNPRAADITSDLGNDVPAVTGDRAQLSQVLHNLIGNAMKYGRAGTPVTVRLWRDAGGMVRLAVTDESEGIAPEHIPRLTERFYRIDPGRSRSLGGTGLGLAIVKHIVERHRGRLDIASRVGQGTTVTILLPPAPPQEAVSSKGNESVTKARTPA